MAASRASRYEMWTCRKREAWFGWINSQNCERIFVADKVVLVEGITDSLVLASLLDMLSGRMRNYEAIEFVEVGGKNNFADYQQLLAGLTTPTFTIADLDYLVEVGSDVSDLFDTDGALEWIALTVKKSRDRQAAVRLLKEAVATQDLTSLEDFLRYVEARCVRLKNPMSDDEIARLDLELATLATSSTFLLRKGEIEDYLPADSRSLKGVVELTTDPAWINRIVDREARVELTEISSAVLGLEEEDRSTLLAEAEKGEVKVTAQPMSNAG